MSLCYCWKSITRNLNKHVVISGLRWINVKDIWNHIRHTGILDGVHHDYNKDQKAFIHLQNKYHHGLTNVNSSTEPKSSDHPMGMLVITSQIHDGCPVSIYNVLNVIPHFHSFPRWYIGQLEATHVKWLSIYTNVSRCITCHYKVVIVTCIKLLYGLINWVSGHALLQWAYLLRSALAGTALMQLTIKDRVTMPNGYFEAWSMCSNIYAI